MVSRNPSEIQRAHEEAVAERNEQYKDLETSRNDQANHHRWCEELRVLRKQLTDGYLCKSDKGKVLARIRELEKLTGFEVVGNYNGGGDTR